MLRAPSRAPAADPLNALARPWLAASFLGLCAVVATAAADEARDWLSRTDRALATRNYVGVFVHELHERGGETETLRVIHRVGADGVSERLVSMDGSGREFIRRGSQLTCYLPDQRTVLVEKSSDAGLLLGSLPRIDATSAGQYDLKLLREVRVSGREARPVEIRPMDQMRYGYRVWIDEATAMPLKSQLLTSHGDVLEQIVFTDLRLPAKIPASELEPSVDARNYRWVHHEATGVDVRALGVSWQANALPPGFRMTASARQLLPSGPVEHLVFSDGLASVSVFVELKPDASTERVQDDAATLGSSSAYFTVVQGYRVTAIGEAPADTVRAIAQSIRTAAPPAVLAGPSGEPETPLGGASAQDGGSIFISLPTLPSTLIGTQLRSPLSPATAFVNASAPAGAARSLGPTPGSSGVAVPPSASGFAATVPGAGPVRH